MKNFLYVISACFLLNFVPELFENDLAFDMALYVGNIQTALLAALVFKMIDKRHLMQRGIALIFCTYVFFEAQLTLIYFLFDYNIYEKSYYIFSFSVVITYLYTYLKPYFYKSDQIIKDNIYFCFWKPKNGLSFFSSILGAPFGGMSIYCQGHLYGFRWNKSRYRCDKVSKKALYKKFVIIDTGIRTNDVILHKLVMLVGNKASILRTNCISTINPVLKEMGNRFCPSFLEQIPSLYASRILNGRI